jgi:uncharacterized protein (TIGR00369 family)
MSTASAQVSWPGFDRVYGLEQVEVGEGSARGKVVVRDELKQALGGVHGGVYAAIADSLTSIATARAAGSERSVVVPLASQTSFLRPITEGTIHAHAVAKHRGRTTWVWEVEICDDRGRLCVLTRMTIAVRDGSGS